MSTTVRVQTGEFNLGDLEAELLSDRTDVGAVASFVGRVRASGQEDGLIALELEHYPGMTEAALTQIAVAAHARWLLSGVTIVHRVGRFLPGEGIVAVLVAASHRADAFAACEYLMDYLKTQAPFWKKEHYPSGARWVEAKASDDVATARWESTS